MSVIFVKYKDRSLNIPIEARRVSLKTLTEACGEPIKWLKSGMVVFAPDREGMISNLLPNTNYNAIPMGAQAGGGAAAPRPKPTPPTAQGESHPHPGTPGPSHRPLPGPGQHAQPHPHPGPGGEQPKRMSQPPGTPGQSHRPLPNSPLGGQGPEKRMSQPPPATPNTAHRPPLASPLSQSHPAPGTPETKRLSQPPGPGGPAGGPGHRPPSQLHPQSAAGSSPEQKRLSQRPPNHQHNESANSAAGKPQRAVSQQLSSSSNPPSSGHLVAQRSAPPPPSTAHRPSTSASNSSMVPESRPPPRSTPAPPPQRRQQPAPVATNPEPAPAPVQHSSPPMSPIAAEPTPIIPAVAPIEHSPAESLSSSSPPASSNPSFSSAPVGTLPIDMSKIDKKERKKVEQAKTYLEELRKTHPDLESVITPDDKSTGNVPRWVPDEKSECCTYCKRKFTMLERRHHCRKCGALLCATCTNYKLDLPELFFKKPVRVCVLCFVKYYEGRLDTVFFDEEAEAEEDEEKKNSSSGGSGGNKDNVTITFIPQPNQKKPYVEDNDDDENLPEDKNERMRIKCIREIVMTEEAYVNDLKVLEEVFVLPLRFNKNISPDIIQQVFSNVEMLRPVHEELLKELGESKAVTTGDSVGKAFLKMCQYLKMYSLYCSNHENAIDTLVKLKDNAEFQHALSVCQSDERAAGQNLDSYIIKPVQRVCKYPLFFRELLKYTPETSPDYADLDLARSKIEEVVSVINEGKRKSEEQRKIMSIFECIDGEWEEDLLQPARRFITEIPDLPGQDMRTNKKHTYKLFVFNDLIVVGKQQSGPGHHKPYLLKGYIPMTEGKVIDLTDSQTMFEVRRGPAQQELTKDSRIPVFQFTAADSEQKNSIVTQLKGLIKQALKEAMSRQSSGMLNRTQSTTAIINKQSSGSSSSPQPATPTQPQSPSSLSVAVPSRPAPPSSSSMSASPQSPTSLSSPRPGGAPGRTPPPRPGGPPQQGGGPGPRPTPPGPRPTPPGPRPAPATPGGGQPVKSPRRAAPPPPGAPKPH